MAAGASNFTKFQLLMWKNWLIIKNHKCQLILELILPVMLAFFVVYIRYMVLPLQIPGAIFFDFSLDLPRDVYDTPPFEKVTYELPYSPKNDFLDNIMSEAVKNLQLKGYKGYKNAKSLEKELTSKRYVAGVQFNDELAHIESYPKKLSFSLRFPSELRYRSDSDMKTWETEYLLPEQMIPGPRDPDENEGSLPHYVNEGFIAIQHAITMAFLKLRSENIKAQIDYDALPEILMQRYPYPEYTKDDSLKILGFFMSIILMLCLIYSVICFTRDVTDEKEKQLKEVMKIMGLQNWIHWAAWFVRSFVVWTIAFALVLIVFKIKWASNAAVLTYSDWTVLLLFLMIYLTCGICFCFLVAVFFTKANLAGVSAGIAWFFSFEPYIGMGQKEHAMTSEMQLGWCTMPNTAMAIGLRAIMNFEKVGEGVHWDNLFDSVKPENLSLGTVMVILFIEAFAFMIICLYIEQIFPGAYGVPEKWNFPCRRDFWCREKRIMNEDKETFDEDMEKISDLEGFEEEPEGKNVGVKVRNLKKKFGDRLAVKGISMNMYEDDISVLLGHNGAGKTTTISMLVGMFPPTSGTAIINGSDIRTNIQGARSSMGICPQHNVLFDDMSVKNHIIFFSRLKGLKGEDIENEIDKYLMSFGMEKQANTPSENLSGGMKRKLSLCCALCGGTKVVLCDEPSSGMDPAARRQLWDMLLAEKVGRTLLLTTHYMDEADVLGDRIAIMSDGELKCYGTPFFLKQKFGSGYRVICEMREDCNIFEVTKLLDKYIPGIQPVSEIGSELTYELPGGMSSIFEKMFIDLENNYDRLGLTGYGVGITSLEEVFLKVGAETSTTTAKQLESKQSFELFSEDSSRNLGMRRCGRQWEAMLFKKALFTWRNKIVFLFRHVFVVLLIAISILGTRDEFSDLPPMTISLTQYPNAIAVLEVKPDVKEDSIESMISNEYKTLIDSYGNNYKVESTGGLSFPDYILNLHEKSQWHIDSHYLAAATISQGRIIAWLNNQFLHTPPLTLNLVHNAIARAMFDSDVQITVINHPLPHSNKKKLEFSRDVTAQNNMGVQMAQHIVLCMAITTALYVYLPIKERVTSSKLLQFVSGVRVWTFWMSQLSWDILTFSFTALVVVITLYGFQEKGFANFDDLLRVFEIFLIFGFAILPCCYLIGFLFKEPVMGFAIVLVINFITGVVCAFFTLMLYNLGLENTGEVFDYIFAVFPHFSLEACLYKSYLLSLGKSMCEPIINSVLCNINPECCDLPDFFDWDRGILRYVVCMICIGLLTYMFLMLIDYRICRFQRTKVHPESGRASEENIDENVLAEKKRILAMSKREIDEQYLVLDRVTKYYKSYRAVNEISLGVKQKECFGLLGVNGAGKTTTFKMMTGDLSISSGSAYVRGISLLSDLNGVYRQIGYCPQFDALIDEFTGREELRIYCLLRGIPRRRIRIQSEKLARAFGFMKHIDKRSKTYSGGNKRKLSTAIAVLGNPSVIYLDEPTAGMDPGARRKLWNMVSRMREAGKSIILTSHSMEECEALCTRLAIMVNGEFKCIGSTQHLKNKFSKGLILKVKIKRPTGQTKLRETLIDLTSSEEEGKFVTPRGSKREFELLSKKLEEQSVQDLNKTSEKLTETEEDRPSLPIQTLPEPERKSRRLRFSRRTKREQQLSRREGETGSKYFVEKHLEPELRVHIRQAKETVKKKYPMAVLVEEYQRTLTFYVPLVDIKWSEIFGFMERNRIELRIEDYSISQTRLEEIFLEFAKQQRSDPRHNKQKGCCKR